MANEQEKEKRKIENAPLLINPLCENILASAY